MRNRAIRHLAAILSIALLLAVVPAQAGPIPFSDVVQVSGSHGQELHLRSTQSNTLVSADTKAAGQQGQQGNSPNSLVSTTGQQQGTVETVEEGDISGTVCNCGELFVPAGFKFPWFALGGVPLVCATGVCSNNVCTPGSPGCNTPCTPGSPDCTPVPEPATLLLLGTGLAALGAGARRRYKLNREGRNLPDTTEV